MLKAIFFDAVGTLIHLTKSVGQHYHLVAQQQGLTLDPNLLETAFVQVWKEMPLRPAIGEPRADDDKDWWRDLVEKKFPTAAERADIKTLLGIPQ